MRSESLLDLIMPSFLLICNYEVVNFLGCFCLVENIAFICERSFTFVVCGNVCHQSFLLAIVLLEQYDYRSTFRMVNILID